MSSHKGKPSGTGKSAGTGTPQNITPENVDQNADMTEKYTDGDNDISKDIRVKNPNRNTDKTEATNAHGYKN